MPKTRRSDEPFCEPSVDASTEAEGRHMYSNSVQVYYLVHCVHTNVLLFT